MAEQEDSKKKWSRWGGAAVVGIALLILLLWCRFCECDQCSREGAPPIAAIPVAEPEAADFSQDLPPVGAGPIEQPEAESVVVAPAVAAPPVAAAAGKPAPARKRPVTAPRAAAAAAAGATAAGTAGGNGAASPAAGAPAAAALPDVGAAGPALAAAPPAGTARDRFSDPADVDLGPSLGLSVRPGLTSTDESLKLVNPCDSAASGCQRSFPMPGAPNNPPVPGPPLPFSSGPLSSGCQRSFAMPGGQGHPAVSGPRRPF